MQKLFLYLTVLILPLTRAKGQAIDSVIVQSDTLLVADSLVSESFHSPKKAAWMSTALPGLGQAYNRKFWKIPIVYGLGGYTVYAALANNSFYKLYRDAYRLRTDGDPLTLDTYPDETDFTLQQRRDEFRRDRDYFWILTGVVYVLNIVDAAVDAHLFYFNVSDKLSMQFLPPHQPYNPYTGRFETHWVSVKWKL